MNAEPIVLVPYHSDPLETLAALMLERHQRELPDLSRHAVVFPNAGAIPRFRHLLLARSRQNEAGGVLVPWCGTLDTWLQLAADTEAAVIDEPERDLLLLDALAPYPALRERYGTWTLVDALLALFDELNAQHPAPPPDVDKFADALAAGYGISEPLEPLRGEAQLVHTLWHAWNAHLRDQHLHDRALQRRAALAKSTPDAAQHVYIVGAVTLSSAEAQWLKRLLDAGRATLLLHGNARPAPHHPDSALYHCLEELDAFVPHPHDARDGYGRFLEAAYASDVAIGARARAFGNEITRSPATDRLQVLAAGDFEQEARAVELAVRRWYAHGIAAIGIVTPDRKLARRVRALLERANLRLRDSAGWALSTTSAATAVMRWIACIEQDFAHAPLLDFLKSPFVTLGLSRAELDARVQRFEEQIVRRYNISGGLERYRRALRYPVTASTARGDDVDLQTLTVLFDRLSGAAQPLQRLLGAPPRPAHDYLTALYKSLEQTGLLTGLSTDAAGHQLLAVLHPERHSAGARGVRLRWTEFRYWLQRELERRRFHPPLPDSAIELLDLADSRCRRFDALIIAGCTQNQLPGTPHPSPFFNDGVRRQLGLSTRAERLLAPLHDFRRLLEAAPRVLLTWRQTEDGEEIVPSPWVERLVAFHRLAYGAIPEDIELQQLIVAKETALCHPSDAPLPLPMTTPAPALPRARLPSVLSASAHQRLLDCPYQFYLADGLGLRTIDEVREEMEKADYGKHVHRILHAFHSGAGGLPGPWAGGRIHAGNRAEAAELLLDLGRRVFAYDADNRLSARGWRYRWESFVPTYLDWQEKREREWQVEATEKPYERALTIGSRRVTLKGRADRIDRGPAGLAIIDYKTGEVPRPALVKSGEKTQLPFYALLHPSAISEVLYAELGEESIKTGNRLHGAELAHLTQLLEARLRTLIAAIDDGAALPAWGDAGTCRFCRYEGICRKEMWDVDG